MRNAAVLSSVAAAARTGASGHPLRRRRCRHPGKACFRGQRQVDIRKMFVFHQLGSETSACICHSYLFLLLLLLFSFLLEYYCSLFSLLPYYPPPPLLRSLPSSPFPTFPSFSSSAPLRLASHLYIPLLLFLSLLSCLLSISLTSASPSSS